MLMSALTIIKDAALFIALVITALVLDVIVHIHCGLLHIIKHEPFKPCVSDIEDDEFIDDFDIYAYSE
jgi:hypothetical protein